MKASSPPSRSIAVPAEGHLGREEAAVFEMFVVPRYLSLFGDRLVAMLAEGSDARVCHVQCRTGYPDRALLERLPNAHVHGCDASPHAIELARAKAVGLANAASGVAFDYRVTESSNVFPSGAFSHAFTVHPIVRLTERLFLFEELSRLLAPRGQALVAMPLRGSFGEILDLLRECALKHELVDLTSAIEAAHQLRPTEALLKREFETLGFEFVETEARVRTLKFSGGRDFFEDPVTRLVLMPELSVNLGSAMKRTDEGVDPFGYVRDAIDKYWSSGRFEMTVHIGIVSGRRKN